MEVIEAMFYEIKDYCPLIKDECKKERCMWYLPSGECAIVKICVDKEGFR